MSSLTAAKVPAILRAVDAESVTIDGLGVRFLVSAAQAGGRFALVEHPIAPRSMGAGIHTHSREDEYSYVIEGEIGVQLGDDVLTARAGDLVFKPRDVAHAFWNPGAAPARVLEVIAPGGMEGLFREVAEAWAAPEPDLQRFEDITNRYALDFDIESELWIPVREGFAAAGHDVAVPETRLGRAPTGSLLGAAEGRLIRLAGLDVRVLVTGARSGGGFALAEQRIAPQTLAVPPRTHANADAYSYVLEGEIGVQVGAEVVHALPGDVVFKPRGMSHAVWNATERPARLVEIVSPSGLERALTEVAELPASAGEDDAEAVAAAMAGHGVTGDREATAAICEREALPLPLR